MDERGRDHGQEHYYCDYDCQERFRGNKPTCVFNLGIFYLRSGPYHLPFKYTRELESSLKNRYVLRDHGIAFDFLDLVLDVLF